jgi:hypothetical protein
MAPSTVAGQQAAARFFESMQAHFAISHDTMLDFSEALACVQVVDMLPQSRRVRAGLSGATGVEDDAHFQTHHNTAG